MLFIWCIGQGVINMYHAGEGMGGVVLFIWCIGRGVIYKHVSCRLGEGCGSVIYLVYRERCHL